MTGRAEREISKQNAITATTRFYEKVPKPTRHENAHLARTDRTELARRNVALVVYVVTNLLRIPGADRGTRPGFMATGSAKIGFGLEHRDAADDLVQDGIIGLLRACQTFDPAKGKFSSHAIPWIISAIQLGDSRQSAVHLPVDVARAIRVEPERLGAGQRVSAMAVIAGYSQLDAPFTGLLEETGDRGTLADYIEQDEPDRSDEMAARDALDALTDEERKVVEHRYGIVGPPLDLQATARLLGKTRREVREIERRAMRKMQAVA